MKKKNTQFNTSYHETQEGMLRIMNQLKTVFFYHHYPIIKFILAFIICVFLFNMLLFSSSLFSSSLIEKNVLESSEILLRESNHYYLPPFYNVINNNYTDAIMINEAYSIDNATPWFSYMSVRKNYKKGLTVNELEDTKGELISITTQEGEENRYDPVRELNEFLNGKVDTSIEYARYWHGYLPFLRVLLIFFNIAQIRYFLLVIFIILFLSFVILLKKKFGLIPSVIFGLTLIIYDYFYVSYSLESAPIFITMMLASIILLINIDKIKNIYLYLFFTACISNFVDFLTVPMITLAVPLVIYIWYRQKQATTDFKENLKIILISCVAWGLGYGFTWLSKWVLYDVIFHKNLVSSAISQVWYRTSRSNSLSTYTLSDVLASFCSPYLEILICYCAAIIINIGKIDIKSYLKSITPYILIGVFPLIWYVTLSNHTVLHVFFVYRHMLIFFLCLMICIYQLVFFDDKES